MDYVNPKLVPMSDLEHEAYVLSQELHKDQKYGDEPYIVHLTLVRDELAAFGFTGDYLIAAWLHDIVEDGRTSIDEINARFGTNVGRLVWSVTGIGANRKLRNADQYEKLKQLPDGIHLKLGDRLANVKYSIKNNNTSQFEMYQREYLMFTENLRSHGGKLCMWYALDKLLIEKLNTTLSVVFTVFPSYVGVQLSTGSVFNIPRMENEAPSDILNRLKSELGINDTWDINIK